MTPIQILPLKMLGTEHDGGSEEKWHKKKTNKAIIPSIYGIFTYVYHNNQINVGKKIPYMDGMGNK